MSSPLLRCLWLAALLGFAIPALAATAPQPFSARYHLEITGWPDAEIRHRLSHEAGHWQSEMRAELPGASGREWGRFRLEDERVRSLHYAAGYSLLGIRRAFSLDHRDLAPLPDRQSALIALARRVIDAPCRVDCRLRYRDHRGREEELRYRILAREPVSLPQGRFEAVRVALTEPGKANRRLVLELDARRPGLLLAMEYHRDGRRRSRLTLTELAPD
ncbi:hypothetical protein ACFPTY_13045 [Halomonas beimenensis]|uniref:DUF3108 domain-containing protein n=1 Tax=Halomonas beimenensis TaxID=475662 RepID=A0A291PAR6_9GAMM|nr:hypothetical protein [Halomonas beimenensis]ATJ83952.1 hypothetical protein BEI_2965 [Halomonas beimenensis]